jgi:ferredoxin
VGFRVIASKCDGLGTCAATCPEVFKLDEWGYAWVDESAVLTDEVEKRARRALLGCPVHAIAEDTA